jgi:hypothetical protein
MTFIPDKIKIVYVFLVGIIKPYLVFIPVILQLPVGRRGDDKMDRFIGNLFHPSRITDNYLVPGLHIFALIFYYTLKATVSPNVPSIYDVATEGAMS